MHGGGLGPVCVLVTGLFFLVEPPVSYAHNNIIDIVCNPILYSYLEEQRN